MDGRCGQCAEDEDYIAYHDNECVNDPLVGGLFQ